MVRAIECWALTHAHFSIASLATSPQNYDVDVNHWLAGVAALVILGLGIRWARQAPPAKTTDKPVKPPANPAPATANKAKSARSVDEPIPNFVLPDDDVEITLIAAFPVPTR